MARRMPPLADLHAFALLSETGGLTRLAAQLNVSQPAASKWIRALEERVGQALVQRLANRIVLTSAGAEYAAAGLPAFKVILAATEALLRPASGPLRVRAYTTWALRWLIPHLPHYQKLQPGHEVAETTSLVPVDFARDPVDVAIRLGSAIPPAPGATRLQRHAIAPFAAPATAQRAKADLTRAMLLYSLARPKDWDSWAAARAVRLMERRVAFESTSLAIQAAAEGIGVVIAPLMLVNDDVASGRLVMLDKAPVATGDYYWLLLPPSSARPEAMTFSNWLVQEVSLGGIATAA
jgi:LysR family glycine cleavage system transcriptional activator